MHTETLPGCKIVMISAFKFPQEAEEIGVSGYFEKQVNVDELCDLLRGG